MSARNSQEAKAERREEREAHASQAEYMAAVAFAIQAERATRAVPTDSLEKAIEYGNGLIQPGVDLDTAVEVEHGQRALRALLTYRRALESATNPNTDGGTSAE